MQTSRRRFIQSGLGCAFGMTLGSQLAADADSAKRIPIAFQLYAVRGEFARDVSHTLKTLNEQGYEGVEFWGYGGTPNIYQKYSAPEMAKLLKESGLKCCGMHLELKALEPDNLERTIDNNRILGSSFLNVAAAQQKMANAMGIGELADFLNATAEKCQVHKMSVGYHAHPFDFNKIEGRFAWELLFSRTKPEVNMQMDVGNCLAGHGDPVAMLKEFPGRTRTIHIKEHEQKTFDSEYYKEVFHLCETSSGTEWYIVEMGGPEGDGFDVPRRALAKLHSICK